MILEDSFVVRAPRDEVAELFLDIDRIGRCIPGLEEVEETEPDHYQAVLAVKVGPIRAAFRGTLELDRSQAPELFAARGQGRDASTQSSVDVSFRARLREEASTTEVTVRADLSVRGRLGRFGTGVIEATATEVLRQFAECVEVTLGNGEATNAPPQPEGLAGAVGRGVRSYLKKAGPWGKEDNRGSGDGP